MPAQRAVWKQPVVAVLLATGLSSLGMEVVWTRQFVPLQGPLVYTFATILAVYLGASYFGTTLYRFSPRRLAPARRGEDWRGLTLAAAAAGDPPPLPRHPPREAPPGPVPGACRVPAGSGPFCVSPAVVP